MDDPLWREARPEDWLLEEEGVSEVLWGGIGQMLFEKSSRGKCAAIERKGVRAKGAYHCHNNKERKI